MNNRLFGAKGESIAASYLLGLGYRILAKNWAVKFGEVDIIAFSPENVIVFVEVKRVSSREYGDAAYKVSPHKLQQIARVASLYLSERELQQCAARIDVVAINGDEISLLKNCFTL